MFVCKYLPASGGKIWIRYMFLSVAANVCLNKSKMFTLKAVSISAVCCTFHDFTTARRVAGQCLHTSSSLPQQYASNQINHKQLGNTSFSLPTAGCMIGALFTWTYTVTVIISHRNGGQVDLKKSVSAYLENLKRLPEFLGPPQGLVTTPAHQHYYIIS